MKIELKEISIRDIAENYVDNAEDGAIGYNGRLKIRPKYQREFTCNEKKRNTVIDNIRKGFPLNVMYWVKNDNYTFEILYGQQQTSSFCQYVSGIFSIDNRAFHNLTETEKQQILDYKTTLWSRSGKTSTENCQMLCVECNRRKSDG